MRFILGVDLGQQQDYTAIVLTEHSRRLYDPNIADTPDWDRRPKKIRNHYVTRLIERPELGTPYPEIVERVQSMLENPAIAGETQLVVDATGVGIPVIEMMRQASLNPVGIWITGGEDVVRTNYGYKVPKKDLATSLQIVFQSRRIKVSKGIALREVFKKELSNFRVKITDSAKETFEAWRQNDHDDIVLAQAIAIWWAEKVNPQRTKFDHDETRGSVAPAWDPLDVDL